MTYEDMAALHALCFDTAPRPWTKSEFSSILNGVGAYSVSFGGGFAVGRYVAGEAELLTLAVRPERRRRGVGMRLLRLYEEKATGRGAEKSCLEVSVQNAAAIALYEKHGYRQAGRRKGYYARRNGLSIDALVMVKDLNPAAGGAMAEKTI